MTLISVDQAEINNWARIAVDLEVAGEVDSVLYERARAIALGQVDPRPKYLLMLSEELPLAA
ncbi:hypothetical protein N8483_02575 [Synechococcus sp. AH-601-O20]|nr:hypothetical protein [Synechococcus sp. AH-601-O20]